MAPIAKSLALAATAFAALSSAAPHHHARGHRHNHKRDEVTVWETVTTVVWTTIDITTTIYPGQEAPPTTIIQETVAEATPPPQVDEPEPEPEPLPESESTTAPLTTTEAPAPTSTSSAKPTSTAQADAQFVELPEVEVPSVTIPTVSVPTEVPVPTTTTSVAPAPQVIKPQPAPEPQPAPAPEPEPEPITAPRTGGSGYTGPCSASSPCTGQITFYDTATSASAPSSCGNTNDGTVERVLALPVGIMQDSDCGKTVTVKYGGNTVTGTVVDKCMGCDNTSIDLSRAFFSALASFDEGRVSGVEWYIN